VLGRTPPWVRLALLVLFAVPTADAAAAAGLPPCPPGGIDHAAVVCELNAARAEAGRGTLRERPSLQRAATAHAEDMVARHYFGHESPDGDNAAARARRAGYLRTADRWRIGEILIWTRGAPLTAAAAVDAWLASPPHRRVLLQRRYEDVGAGVASGAPAGNEATLPATTIAVTFGRRSG
jgi:uncharacterized protein YkwD